MDGKNKNFDPLFDDEDEEYSNEVPDEIVDEYWDALEKAKGYWKTINTIREKARNEGIIIKDNTKKIQEATRQGMNSPIQGTAGDMVKNAMVKVGNYKYWEKRRNELKDDSIIEMAKEFERLGGRMLIQVHDEVIAEAPIPVVFEASRLLEKIMIKSAAEVVTVPMKADVEIFDRWYGTEIKEVA
jgi:DNA polymerase I-like protein with 3'-5' exonuclease and polymerase domains